jgi:hypothetical protein
MPCHIDVLITSQPLIAEDYKSSRLLAFIFMLGRTGKGEPQALLHLLNYSRLIPKVMYSDSEQISRSG